MNKHNPKVEDEEKKIRPKKSFLLKLRIHKWVHEVNPIITLIATVLAIGLTCWQFYSSNRIDKIEEVIGRALQKAEDAEKASARAIVSATQADQMSQITSNRVDDASNKVDNASERLVRVNSELNTLESQKTAISRSVSDQETRVNGIGAKLSDLDGVVKALSQESEAARRQYEEARAKAVEIDRETQQAMKEPLERSMIRITIIYEKTNDIESQSLSNRLSSQGYRVKRVLVDEWDADARTRRRNANINVPPEIPARGIIVGGQAAHWVSEVVGILKKTVDNGQWSEKQPKGQEATYYDIWPDQLLIMIR